MICIDRYAYLLTRSRSGVSVTQMWECNGAFGGIPMRCPSSCLKRPGDTSTEDQGRLQTTPPDASAARRTFEGHRAAI